MIARYDTPETLFYVDPPYVHSARGDSSAYGFEMSDEEHVELAKVLQDIRGRAVVSGYRTDLYDSLFSDWQRVDAAERLCHFSQEAPPRVSLAELLMNNQEIRVWLDAVWAEVLAEGVTTPDPSVDKFIDSNRTSIRYAVVTQMLGKVAEPTRSLMSLQPLAGGQPGDWNAP